MHSEWANLPPGASKMQTVLDRLWCWALTLSLSGWKPGDHRRSSRWDVASAWSGPTTDPSQHKPCREPAAEERVLLRTGLTFMITQDQSLPGHCIGARKTNHTLLLKPQGSQCVSLRGGLVSAQWPDRLWPPAHQPLPLSVT